MIHYHGTPISGPADRLGRFFEARHALVSYAYQDQMCVVADQCQSYVLDNGAYTLWRRGQNMTPQLVDKILDFYESWGRRPSCDWVLIPDKIDGSESDNDSLIDDFPVHLRGVPVWHYHESLGRLDRLVNSYQTVALGSSGEWPTPGVGKWWDRTQDVMNVACDGDGVPHCRLHGLRMLSEQILKRVPLSSADSTYVGRTAGLDKRFLKTSPIHIWQRADGHAANIERMQSATCWRQTARQLEFQMSVK